MWHLLPIMNHFGGDTIPNSWLHNGWKWLLKLFTRSGPHVDFVILLFSVNILKWKDWKNSPSSCRLQLLVANSTKSSILSHTPTPVSTSSQNDCETAFTCSCRDFVCAGVYNVRCGGGCQSWGGGGSCSSITEWAQTRILKCTCKLCTLRLLVEMTRSSQRV